ncbi:MAG: UDP-N-acetylglucosamine--LPS N-acetylglucosamine transferase [Candidatus Omnitrophica bacterium]|nr:UDP-N-acetylglucosamine--LPS N-acetylglucosamine transferase [Candidatus Omnitrophota bacterium]
MNLSPWWKRHEHFWVTFRKEDATSLLQGEKVYYARYPTNRNIFNLFHNTFLALKVLLRERPTLVFSTGAAVAVPFILVGKIMRAQTVFMEVYDRIDSPTVTGKIVYWMCDKFLIQWEDQKRYYPKAELWGQSI